MARLVPYSVYSLDMDVLIIEDSEFAREHQDTGSVSKAIDMYYSTGFLEGVVGCLDESSTMAQFGCAYCVVSPAFM